MLRIKLRDKILEEMRGGCLNRKCFLQYYSVFGLDDFLKSCYPEYKKFEEDVYVVNVDGQSEDMQNFIDDQIYVKLKGVEFNDDIFPLPSRVKYVCFFEKLHLYDEWKIVDMVLSLVTSRNDIAICYRNYLNGNNCIIKDITSQYWNELKELHLTGAQFLEMCVCNQINLYGDLSTLLVRATTYNQMQKVCKGMDVEEKFKILYEILLRGNIHFVNRVYTLKQLEHYEDRSYRKSGRLYQKYLDKLMKEKRMDISGLQINGKQEKNIFSEITFFYTDSAEYFNLQPIAEYAKKKGYDVIFTDNIMQKAEIGVYCQHACHPENSKFSIVLLHDMAQRHDIWPNIWLAENWDKFDIGILPGKEWAVRWKDCASAAYARPRKGVYAMGSPKVDKALSKDIFEKADGIKNKFKYDFTVLYAPSWENDSKEDDFVKCLVDLPINLLIKQVPVPNNPEFQFVSDNIAEMRKLHEGKYENLVYMEPDDNILVALAAADMVVSDESSVMTEATIFGLPSVAIMDWLIPDTKPSRYACVIKRKKSQLRNEVLQLLRKDAYYKEAQKGGADFFVNKGSFCKNLLDLIDASVKNKEMSDELKQQKLFPTYEIIDMWN